MKSLLIISLLMASGLHLAADSPKPSYAIPDFAADEVTGFDANPDLYKATTEQLRAMVVQDSDRSLSSRAVDALLQKGDIPTGARIIYSARQGNFSSMMAIDGAVHPSLIPFLLEDVARGRTKDLETHWPSHPDGSEKGTDVIFETRFRVIACGTVLSTLREMPGLPPESARWIQTLSHARPRFRGDGQIVAVTEAVIEWWRHNGEAVLAGRVSEATWVPETQELILPPTPNPLDLDKPPRPPETFPYVRPPPDFRLLPYPAKESFRSWVARVKEGRLDLTLDRLETGKKSSVAKAASPAQKATATQHPLVKKPIGSENSGGFVQDTSYHTWLTGTLVLVLAAGAFCWWKFCRE